MMHSSLLLFVFATSNSLAAAVAAPAPTENPAQLGALEYLPPGLAAGAPLVVALHACEQFAFDYDAETGWVDAANAFGFALLLPEQRFANNPYLCFNWFAANDASRRAEVTSIAAMTREALRRHRLDANRVYVTGLSAGAAMAQVMLVTHPELFAGGALVAGIAYGCADDATSAFECLVDPGERSPAEWGALARAAAPSYDGEWPRVSIWQGTADPVVAPVNAEALVRQWQQLHGAFAAPVEDALDGAARTRWGDGSLERIMIEGMSHGTPVDLDSGCGEPDVFTLDVGICGATRIAEFWRLDQPASEPPRILEPEAPTETPAPEPAGCAAGLPPLLLALGRRRSPG